MSEGGQFFYRIIPAQARKLLAGGISCACEHETAKARSRNRKRDAVTCLPVWRAAACSVSHAARRGSESRRHRQGHGRRRLHAEALVDATEGGSGAIQEVVLTVYFKGVNLKNHKCRDSSGSLLGTFGAGTCLPGRLHHH